jgi:uncharacterized protein YdcH (DUF465 family)
MWRPNVQALRLPCASEAMATRQAGRLRPIVHPKEFFMFPEYRDLITQLKTTDHHFTRLFDQHNAVDQKIKNLESRIEAGTPEEIEKLKKEKLHLKDQLYTILKQGDALA